MSAQILAGEEGISASVEILRRGGVVGLPTETVYGLAADAFQSLAVARIFEAKGRPLVEVFHTIHNETRQEAEDLIGRVLREDHVIDMAMQTVLITRDGTEYQIEDSCAPIHDMADNIIGTV
ncbi:MAG: Sua5/YciO/YrdC/YwlC family protein, partial [bacterium]